MSAKVQVGDLGMAILFGVAIGLAVGFGAYGAGLPSNMVGPLTGAVVGSLVSLIYRGRASKRLPPPDADGGKVPRP